MSHNFQFHVTVGNLNLGKITDFISLCEKLNVKPLLIELPVGDYLQQPMFTQKPFAKNLKEARVIVAKTITELQKNGFAIAREKAEVHPDDACYFTEHYDGFTPYFEWHGTVLAEPITLVEAIATKNGAVVSKDSLDIDKRRRFITVRTRDNKEKFYAMMSQVVNELKANNIEIVNEHLEYAVYDSCLALDGGWAEKSQLGSNQPSLVYGNVQ